MRVACGESAAQQEEASPVLGREALLEVASCSM